MREILPLLVREMNQFNLVDMKRTFIAFALLFLCVGSALAQFRRGSDFGVYPYITNFESGDVLLVGRPGGTNFNYGVTNLPRALAPIAATWEGPTNVIDLVLTDLTYVTSTDCSLTGVLNYDENRSLSARLTISNASPSVVGFTIPQQWRTDDGLRKYWVTNGCLLDVIVSAKKHMTNCICIPFF